MEPGVSPAWAAMRGMVVPSTPWWPSTSAAALSSLRSDSRLRACCGTSDLADMGESLAGHGTGHVCKCEFTFTYTSILHGGFAGPTRFHRVSRVSRDALAAA